MSVLACSSQIVPIVFVRVATLCFEYSTRSVTTLTKTIRTVWVASCTVWVGLCWMKLESSSLFILNQWCWLIYLLRVYCVELLSNNATTDSFWQLHPTLQSMTNHKTCWYIFLCLTNFLISLYLHLWYSTIELSFNVDIHRVITEETV